jgi:hypothetical protein
LPAKAETSISSVDSGRWKLVISASTAADAIAGKMKMFGLAGERLQFAILTSCASSARMHGGADRDHAAAAARVRGDLLAPAPRPRSATRCASVLAEVVDPHRLEGAGADMQREPAELDAAFAQRRQQRIVEVQAGGGRGDRAEFAGEHGLVALVVVRARLALDVGRQRQAAVRSSSSSSGSSPLEAQVEELASRPSTSTVAARPARCGCRASAIC